LQWNVDEGHLSAKILLELFRKVKGACLIILSPRRLDLLSALMKMAVTVEGHSVYFMDDRNC
jgi:hypothetical protein